MGSFNLPPLPPPAGGVPNRGSQPVLPARPSLSSPSAPLPYPPVEPNIPVSSLLPYGEPVEGSEGYQPVYPVSLYSQGKEEGEPPVRKKRGWLIVMIVVLVAVILGAG